jgi:phage-related protein
MTWTVTFYNEKVERETLALPASVLANFLRIAELIEEFGPELGRPHTAPLGDGLFEIRAKGREGIARSIFCMLKGREVVILMIVIKKSNALPKRYRDLAVKRRRIAVA